MAPFRDNEFVERDPSDPLPEDPDEELDDIGGTLIGKMRPPILIKRIARCSAVFVIVIMHENSDGTLFQVAKAEAIYRLRSLASSIGVNCQVRDNGATIIIGH